MINYKYLSLVTIVGLFCFTGCSNIQPVSISEMSPSIKTADVPVITGQMHGGEHLYSYPLGSETGSVFSPNGKYQLILQNSDGNLVLYNTTKGAIWANYTAYTPRDGRQLRELLMQTDGNLVVYERDWYTHAVIRVVWNSGTSHNPGAWLSVQDDGNTVIYSANNVPLWKTNTRGR